MLTTSTVADRIRRELVETEITVNSAIQQVAALMQSIAMARGIPGVGLATGQAAVTRLAQMQSNLVAASSDGFRVHGELSKVQAEVLGVFDESGECPWPSQASAKSELEDA